jgi:4-amino-4-deoxy-L-arabinose transferase-like glycosyltransferase
LFRSTAHGIVRLLETSDVYLRLPAFMLLAFAAFVWAAPLRDLYGLEARNALMGREMLEGGMTFFPYAMGRPYPDYPPLYFWLETLAAMPFGRMTTLSAVLPSALAATGLLGLGFSLGRQISPRLGWLTALVLATLPGFWLSATRATIDMLLALHVSAALVCLYFRDRTGDRGARRAYTLAIPVLLLLAFLTKGPIGLVLPAWIWGCYLLLSWRIRELARFALFMAALTAACMAAELAVCWKSGGEDLVRSVIEMQLIGRVGQEANVPAYYYSLHLLGVSAPWWFLALPLLPVARAELRGKVSLAQLRQVLTSGSPAGYSLVWLLCTFILFSMASTRKGRYLLPLFLPLALLLALTVDRGIRQLSGPSSRLLERCLEGGIVVLLFAAWGLFAFVPGLRVVSAAWIAVWSFVILLGWLGARRAAATGWGPAGPDLLVQPVISHRESGKIIASSTESRVSAEVPVVLYGIAKDGDGVKYALYSSRRPADLRFVSKEEGIRLLPRPSVVVAYERNWPEIRAGVPASDVVIPLAEGPIHGQPVAAFLLQRGDKRSDDG